ncbi:hypothetical protein [uncultured Roseobacter sp.]|uniref:hypothetical protein n=1 Tax=uncultured Roseobacter sp. TaxID=114847 RepID=UPI002617CC4E|nr:hypothetical protein [uncultured Roseobacter sp.]
MFLEWRLEAGHEFNSSHNEPNIDPFIRFVIPRALPGSRFGEAIKERIMLGLAPKKAHIEVRVPTRQAVSTGFRAKPRVSHRNETVSRARLSRQGQVP